MRRFSSCPLGQANGQDDLAIRLLLLRLRLDTRTADELEAVIHAVQEQPHVPHDELADAALRRLLRVLFRKIGVDIRLRLCHVELLADNGLQHGQPVLLLRQPQQRPRVPLRELVLPQHGQHLRAVAQQAQLVRHGALTFAREAGTFASKKYQATASLGKLISGTNFHVGYLIAIAAVILLYILVYKTKFGYEVRISGSNPEFAKYSGIRTSRVIIMTQVIAGAVAGLGGAVEQMGMYQRFNWQDSPSYAWDGVIIAILSGNNPKMVPFAAFFLAYIRVGADLMSRRSDVQNELVSIIQAVLILFVTAERFMAGWKQREEAKKALKGEA